MSEATQTEEQKKLENQLPSTSKLAKIALDKLLMHLAFLSERNIAFAFFDERIAVEERELMVARMNIEGTLKFPFESGKLILKYNKIKDIRSSDFVSKKTMVFFTDLKLDTSFLSEKVINWPSLDSYQKCKQYAIRNANKILVVNDAAERAIRFVQEYNSSQHYDEESFQEMCVLFRYRKE